MAGWFTDHEYICHDNQIYENILFGIFNEGIVIDGLYPYNNIIRDNIVIDAGRGGDKPDTAFYISAGATGNTIKDNFFYDKDTDKIINYKGLLHTVEEANSELPDFVDNRTYGGPMAVAGTSLDGNSMLQLDGTLSSDPQGDLLTFGWQIEGEPNPRVGQIVSIGDLPVGNYQITLTVSDGIFTGTDTMLLGVPAIVGVPPPPVGVLQEQVQNIKDKLSNYSTSSFDAPNDKAAENRRKALLNMLDKVSEHIDAGDFQAAIDQLRDVYAKSDAIYPPDSTNDWIVDDPATTDVHEQQEIAQLVIELINDLDALL